MDRVTEYRVQQIPEDAADGVDLIVPVPPKPWSCGECGQRNHGTLHDCAWCGRDREEVEA